MVIDTEMVGAVEQRYRDRRKLRAETQRKIAAGDILHADTPERVIRRLQRLGFSQSDACHALSAGRAALAPDEESVGTPEWAFERTIGETDLISLSFFETGLVVARTVGRIHICSSKGRASGWGTGFLVSPRLLMTNHHVLRDEVTASDSSVEFDYQEGLDGSPRPSFMFDFDPTEFFVASKDLDYAVVAVNETSREGRSLGEFGWNRLVPEEGKAIIGEYLNIVQHPDGQLKQVAIRNNRLVDLLEDYLHYETDTGPGSSGAPVFNSQWEVVALHHAGVPRRDAEGQYLSKEGKPLGPGRGEHAVDWVANEGVRISRISRDLMSHPVSSKRQAGLREAVFAEAGQGSNAGASMPLESTANQRDSGVVGGSGVGQSWVIPLCVRVEMRPPIPGPIDEGHLTDPTQGNS